MSKKPLVYLKQDQKVSILADLEEAGPHIKIKMNKILESLSKQGSKTMRET